MASIVRAVPESVASSNDTPPVTAVVLTYRRPRLAGDVVRGLLDKEGFPPHRVVLVVNGQGGLDDAELEATVCTIRLPVNIGPAGGFRAGLEAAFEDGETQWAYLCEDDVGLFNLPSPRVSDVLDAVESPLRRRDRALLAPLSPTGAVSSVAGIRSTWCPGRGARAFVPVDVAPWGATLVARTVVERGVLPATEWFFGFEDFDFFCRLRASGLSVLLDSEAARVAALVQTSAGREIALSTDRPSDAEEPWRAYYVARNHFHLARAHGSPSWQAWHLAYSARRLQLASSNAERLATLHGLVDGLRGRWGPHPRYGRTTGEHDPPA